MAKGIQKEARKLPASAVELASIVEGPRSPLVSNGYRNRAFEELLRSGDRETLRDVANNVIEKSLGNAKTSALARAILGISVADVADDDVEERVEDFVEAAATA